MSDTAFALDAHKPRLRINLTPELIAWEERSQQKLCSKCRNTLPFSDFNTCKKARHGLHSHCRACQAIVRAAYTSVHGERERAEAKRKRADPAVRAANQAAWTERYRSDLEFRESVLAKNRERRKNEKHRALEDAARRRREEADPARKIARNMRVRVRRALLGLDKAAGTLSLLGCSQEELRQHIEAQFESGMTWGNYGYHGWHIDHFRPCASFDLADERQQRICFHYTNLRPMWRAANQSKGDNVPIPHDLRFNADLAFAAMLYAREMHRDQKRKYTGDEYFSHLAEVAGLAAAVTDVNPHLMMAVAFLHDVREDCGISSEELTKRFGPEVAFAVDALSDLETGNRAQRKAAARERLASAPGWVQTIKCADLISNTASIVQHDPKFAVVYLEEKRLLLDVLTEADPRLLAIARAQVASTEEPKP